ncbi:MAG: hypothetical protein E6J64_10925, partial [Deltaproteobacteria bacterium]
MQLRARLRRDVLVSGFERVRGQLVERLRLLLLGGDAHRPLPNQVLRLVGIGDVGLLRVGHLGDLRLAAAFHVDHVAEVHLVLHLVVACARGWPRRADARGGRDERRRLQRPALALHARRRPQRVVQVVLGHVEGKVHRGGDLADQEVPRAVVQLALLLRERPHPAQRMQSLEHVERALQPAAGHAVR